MYKLIYLARREPNCSREGWPELWNSHSAFAGKFPGLRGGIKFGPESGQIEPLDCSQSGIAILAAHGAKPTTIDEFAIALVDNLPRSHALVAQICGRRFHSRTASSCDARRGPSAPHKLQLTAKTWA